MRLVLVLAVATLNVACVMPSRLVRADPVQGTTQEVFFKDGTPIVLSRGARVNVSVAPIAGPTGRYRFESRLGIMVAIRNLDSRRIEVSEANVTATANGAPARVVPAAEIEEQMMSSAAWAHSMNVFGAGLSSMGAAMTAGSTTYSGTVGGVPVSGTSYNADAARQAQRQVNQDAAARSAAISADESRGLGGVASMLQRNTVDPGAVVRGAVVVMLPRTTACKVKQAEEQGGTEPTYGPGPCRVRVLVTVGGEVHEFVFAESVSGA